MKSYLNSSTFTACVWILGISSFIFASIYSLRVENQTERVAVDCEVLTYSAPYTKPEITCRDMFSPAVTKYSMTNTKFFLEARDRNAKHVSFYYEPLAKTSDLQAMRFWTNTFVITLVIGLIWGFICMVEDD